MPKLTISATFILPDDPLQSAQAQVAILTAGEAFKAALAKLKAEHEYTVSIGDGPAADVVKQRKPRKARTPALGSTLGAPQEPAQPAQPPVEAVAAPPTPPTAAAGVPWAKWA